MKLAILGAGIQARAILDDFLRFSGAEMIGIADVDESRARALADERGDARVRPAALDVRDEPAVREWLEPYDAAISAVPYRFNLGLARAAVAARCSLTDLGGNNDVVDATLALDAQARDAGVTLIPDLGLAPGMVGLLGADLVRSLDGPRRLELRVGGLPRDPEWPLNYRLFFSVQGLINEYIEPCRLIRAGKKEVVPGLTELESLSFPAPFGELEAFQTSGGTSTLIESLHGEVEDLNYKTIRYPGHNDQIRTMQALGMFEHESIEVDGQSVIPRRVTETLFSRNLGEEVADVVLVRITAEGTRDGQAVRIIEEMIEHRDDERSLSAMARCTGFPAAIVTTMIAQGAVDGPGARPQEACVPADRFREALAERGLTLSRRTESL
jgi:lysine 6-dehydrogenase